MAQQTAVEWLEEQFLTERFVYDFDFDKAKEMEKQQKKDAWVDGNDTHRCITSKEVDECFDDYYTQTYGK